MTKMWIGVVVCLWLPVLCLAQEKEETRFRQVALLILQQRLEHPDVDYLEGVVNQIARETHLPDAEARKRLVVLLDSLEVQRKGKTALWKKLAGAGGKEVPAKTGEKFLGQLAEEARKLLVRQSRGRGDYALQDLVDQAAQNTGLLPHQGKDLLLQALSLGSGSTVPRLAGIPNQIGIVVEVQNRLAGGADPAQATAEAAAKLQTDQLDQVLLPALLRELPASPRIKWAVEKPDPAAPPDYLLSVAIEDLQDCYSGGQMQKLSLTAQLALKPAAGQAQVYQRPLVVDQYTSVERANTPGQTDEFFKEVALKIRTSLDDFLSAR